MSNSDIHLEHAEHNQSGSRCLACGFAFRLSIHSQTWTASSGDGNGPDNVIPDHDWCRDRGDDAAGMSNQQTREVSQLQSATPDTWIPEVSQGQSTSVYVVVFYGDGEVASAQIFTTRASALTCRDEFIRRQWNEFCEDKPLPDDPEEAAYEYDGCASGQGQLVHITQSQVQW